VFSIVRAICAHVASSKLALPEFVNINKTKDKTNIKWQLTQLSITFKELFANE
jgi:hypothetical protein